MQLNPYIFFNGQCEEAFKFYAQCFNGKIDTMMPHAGTPGEQHVPAEWRDKVMLEQTFWAARFGMCVDRFGIPWMINCEGSA
jgi:uncharacterized glyoxalase superfamily protein PhnB